MDSISVPIPQVKMATKTLLQYKDIEELTKGHYWRPGFTPAESSKGEDLWAEHVNPGVRKLMTLKMLAPRSCSHSIDSADVSL